jgi:hypothetical protein
MINTNPDTADTANVAHMKTLKRLMDIPKPTAKPTMAQASYDYWMKLSDKHGGRAGIKRRMRAIDRRIDDLTRERDDLMAAHRNLLRAE